VAVELMIAIHTDVSAAMRIVMALTPRSNSRVTRRERKMKTTRIKRRAQTRI
jgi:hypothetical protein